MRLGSGSEESSPIAQDADALDRDYWQLLWLAARPHLDVSVQTNSRLTLTIHYVQERCSCLRNESL